MQTGQRSTGQIQHLPISARLDAAGAHLCARVAVVLHLPPVGFATFAQLAATAQAHTVMTGMTRHRVLRHTPAAAVAFDGGAG